MGAVSIADVESVLSDQSAGEPSRLGDTLVECGKVTPEQLARALSEQYGLPFVSLPPIPREVLVELSLPFQRLHRAVPFGRSGAELSVAIADPSDVELFEAMKLLPGRRVQFFLAAGDQIDAAHAEAELVLAAPAQVPGPAAPIGGAPPSPAAAPMHHLTADELFADLSLESVPDDRGSSLSGLMREPASRLAFPEANGIPSPDAAPTAPAAPPRSAPAFEASSFEGDALLSGVPPAFAVTDTSGAGEGPADDGAEGERQFAGLLEGLGADGPGSDTEAAEGPLADTSRSTGERPIIDAEVVVAAPEESASFDEAAFLGKRDPAFATPSFESFDEQPMMASPSGIRELRLPPAALDPLTASRAGVQLPGWISSSPPGSAGDAAPAQTTPAPVSASSSSLVRGPEGEWTGALDATAPSKLVVGLVKVLLRRGLVSERELLEALKRR